ncbi:hypothetical protein F7731_23865 [Cytobacillus depressus]|uniref:Uncharacterized protein n=1 Tax=Cytobacillus depressus TaxID=1602942 RepID=A0A6L3UYC4_9BACI|nr:hypothetical protein [Cytobacillus depressus]KAB2328990.1 hypothetical protein F7731_23865 [Cytobacillus depressus]
MYQYVGYYHPFTAYPYTSQNIVRYPYSYPYVYQAPYINHPLYQVQQQNRRPYDVTGYWDTKFSNYAGTNPQIPLVVHLATMALDRDQVTGWYSPVSGTQGTLDGKFSGDTLKGTWETYPFVPPYGKGTFEFTFKSDGKSFTGLWGYGKEAPHLPWNGTIKP